MQRVLEVHPKACLLIMTTYDGDGNAIIQLDANDVITVYGITSHFVASDFVFA